MNKERRINSIDNHTKYIGKEAVERIKSKADSVSNLHVTHINSTYYGGGVAELLGSLTLLMNSVGIKTGWRVIQGSPDFFSITKKFHNGLQGEEINL
jgi:trehalose synthase